MLAPETEYMRICPTCEKQIPNQVVICWNCGECLDPHILELAKADKAAKK